MEKPAAQRPLGRPRGKWENNIKTDIKYIVWEGVDLSDLAQDIDKRRPSLVNSGMKFQIP